MPILAPNQGRLMASARRRIKRLLGPEWSKLVAKALDHTRFWELANDIENYLYVSQSEKNIQNAVEKSVFNQTSQKRINIGLLDIAVIVPQPAEGSGGNRNIYRIIKNLKNLGHHLTVYYTQTKLHPALVKKRVQRWFYNLEGIPFIKYNGVLGRHDVGLATWWETAYHLQDNKDKVSHCFYLVQDFEPMFMPVSSNYLLAEATYTLGFNHICSGRWCAEILRSKYGLEADYFNFPVDKNIYNTNSPRTKENKNLLFFAKPEIERRCFELGIEALRIFHQLKPNVEIILYGSPGLGARAAPFPFTNMGVLPDLSNLAHLYRNADFGLVFSPTNPSLVPFEMLACGCPVGDVNIDQAIEKYGADTRNVFLLPVAPKALGQKLAEIFDDPAEMKKRAAAGQCYVEANFPSESEMANQVEQFIIQKISKDQFR